MSNANATTQQPTANQIVARRWTHSHTRLKSHTRPEELDNHQAREIGEFTFIGNITALYITDL